VKKILGFGSTSFAGVCRQIDQRVTCLPTSNAGIVAVGAALVTGAASRFTLTPSAGTSFFGQFGSYLEPEKR
jgi:hypothetical protein